MRSIIAASLFLIGIIVLTAAWGYHANLQNSVRWTCDIIHEAYYKKTPELNEWRNACREGASRLAFGASKEDAVKKLNYELDQVGISHLSIYEPEKAAEMWDNKAVDNGLRIRSVDGAFIIYSIIPGSVTSEFEINIGDEIVKVNDEPVRSVYDLRFASGKFDIRRLAANGEFEELEVILLARELVEDMAPSLTKLSSSTGVLKLQSFLPQYFEKENWLKTVSEFSNLAHVIIDLRGNAGGSFVSMLRALSPFLCQPTSVGIISANIEGGRNASEVENNLADDLEARIQIDQIESESSLLLKTFDGYGCSDAKATVFVDAATASTGEIFAYAMSGRPDTNVWGVPTAGEVVVARWFDLSPLGFNGYSLSVPIAGFTTTDGIELEAEGITPTRLLFYDQTEARKGKDSWIEAATVSHNEKN